MTSKKLEKEVEDFVKEIFMEKHEMTDKDLEKALEEKCRKDKDNQGPDKQPAFQLLCPREQTNYIVNLKKHVKKAFENKKGQATRKVVKVEEFGPYLLRYFLNSIGKQAEFDHVVADKASSTFLHFEVKSYPQTDAITKDGLRLVLHSAKTQHEQGDLLFNNVLGPAAGLSSGWTKMNLLFFPNVLNRALLQAEELGGPIDDVFLKYILTEAELENDQWLADLQLGSIEASTEEYERLLAIIIGSAHVSYNSQVFDYQREIREVYRAVAGEGVCIGIGPHGAFPSPLFIPKHFDPKNYRLQKKHTDHVQNIIFWNDEQMQLLEDLKTSKSLVLCGDYGVGKTSVMVSAAQKAALDGFKVFIVTTASFNEIVDTSYILDVAMKDKFQKLTDKEGIDLEVISLMDIKKTIGLGFNSSVTDLIGEFMKKIGDNSQVKIFFDEFPVSLTDLEAVRNDENSNLIKMLKAIDENSFQAFVSLKTTCDLDTGHKSMGMRKIGMGVTHQMLKDHIESRTTCKVKVLNLRMRNTSKMGNAAVANMEKYQIKNEGGFPVACILDVGNSEHTVPGERPDCVVAPIGFNKPNMQNIAMCLEFSLTQLLHLDSVAAGKLSPHIVILCGDGIPPREVWKTIDYLNIQPVLYDGGVEAYRYATAHHYPIQENPSNDEFSTVKQKANLLQWLEGTGGILVTHNRLFAGMEAPTVILITKTIGTNETAVRSGMLRAVAKLIVITDTTDANVTNIEEHFDVTHMPDFNDISDDEEEE